MSHRELAFDNAAVRQSAYKKLSENDVQEALWEALDTLHTAGIDIGPKAIGILDARAEIKLRAPKSPTN
jgi:hypothetical protein